MGNIGYTGHINVSENPRGNQVKDNPETLLILGTQDIGQINVRENPRGNQEDNPETLAFRTTSL
jgi:hypothetical protein